MTLRYFVSVLDVWVNAALRVPSSVSLDDLWIFTCSQFHFKHQEKLTVRTRVWLSNSGNHLYDCYDAGFIHFFTFTTSSRWLTDRLKYFRFPDKHCVRRLAWYISINLNIVHIQNSVPNLNTVHMQKSVPNLNTAFAYETFGPKHKHCEYAKCGSNTPVHTKYMVSRTESQNDLKTVYTNNLVRV